jgi:hypothetical protein
VAGLNLNIPVDMTKCSRLTDFWATLLNYIDYLALRQEYEGLIGKYMRRSGCGVF